MSTLVIQIPPRPRLRARSVDAVDPDSLSATQYHYAISPDGVMLQSHGFCAAALLPKAATVVAVISDEDVSWHRINLPKAPAARLQSALVGVLEEALLEDADTVHLALAPEAVAGAPTWVAACEHAWLSGELAVLEKALVFVDRVVPMSWPDEPARGHFSAYDVEFQTHPAHNNAQGTFLSWAHPEGVAVLNLQGGLARGIVPTPQPGSAHWSATPGAVEAAEAWLGFPVAVMAWPQRALQATRSLWNLRQFGLARKNRGTRALRDLWRQFLKPEWRPVRWGLVGLAALHMIGINLWALQQRSSVGARKAAMVSVLQTAHPQERPVLDAPLQMQRATDALKTAAGRPAESDFETVLQISASAWPADRPPVDNLRFESGKLTLATVGWTPEHIAQFGNQLRPHGWQVDSSEGRIVLTRQNLSTASRSP
jgi:general secretion pathway protein L